MYSDRNCEGGRHLGHARRPSLPPPPAPTLRFIFLIGRVGVGGWDRGKWGRKRLLSIVTSVKSLSLLMVIEAVTAEDSYIRLARGPSPLSLPPTFPWVGLGLGLGMGGGGGGVENVFSVS